MSTARSNIRGGSTASRRIPRSIGAVLAGLAAIAILSLVTDQIFHSAGVYPPWGEPMFDTVLCLLALSYRVVYTTAGGYLVAMLVPHSPMRHALALGMIGLVLGTAGGIASQEMAPAWFLAAIALTAVPCAWLGGLLYSKSTGGA